MSTFIQDIRYGARMLVRSPVFTLVAVAALALGIGANTAIFSVVYSVLLRSLPFRDPASLVQVWEASPRDQRNVVSPANYLDWKSRNRVFGDIAAVVDIFSMNLTGAGEPEELLAGAVTTNFFQMIGVQPIIGRAFLAEEDTRGRDHVAILSHTLWRKRFASDPGTVGRSIALNGELYQVTGILPPDFVWNNRRTDVWTPYPINPGLDYRSTTGRYMSVAARLRPDITLRRAQEEMSAIARRLEEEYPRFNKNWGVNLVPLHEQTVGQVRPALLVLQVAVGFVLLIACVNVANLLLARAAARQREIAVRAALGAGRWRLVRQLLTESLLLAVASGLLGLLLASWGVDALVALAPASIPRLSEIGVNRGIFTFTALVSLGTGILFGLALAIEISKTKLNDALKEGGRGSTGDARRSRMRGLLVIAEVALALVLLIGAGLMLRSFGRLEAVNPGFSTERVLTLRVSLPGSKYTKDAQIVSFFQQAVERIGRVRGVRLAGAVNNLPLTGMASATSFTIVGRPDPGVGNKPVTGVRVAHPNYFAAMGVPLLKGRGLSERDTQQTPRVLVVSSAFVHQYFPDEDPIGKKVIISWRENVEDEIVGVVGDVLHDGLDSHPQPMIYWPAARMPYNFMTLVAATEGAPANVASAVIKEIHDMDPELPVSNVRAMDEVVAGSVSRQRFNMLLLAVLAGVAMVLAVVGIYGVMAYGVTQRTHELGIRMALGAGRGDVMRMVLGQGLVMALSGVALGVGAALVLTRLMRSLLFEVTATDPAVYAGVSFLLVVVAIGACYVPAWRATHVDPLVALRYE